MSNINWIEIILGAILGFCLPGISQLISYFVRRLKKDYLEGEWYWYNLSMNESENSVSIGKLKIRKGITKKFLLNLEIEGNEQLSYRGFLVKEKNYFILKLEGKVHAENVTVRLFDPIPGKKKLAHGLLLGLNYSSNPLAAPVLISGDKLSIEEAEKLTLKYCVVNNSNKILTSYS